MKGEDCIITDHGWASLSENHLINGYESKLGLFKSLSAEECKDYIQWARDNYVCGEPINEVWHPVVQTECHLMNAEKDNVECES